MERLRWGVLGRARIARRHVVPALQAASNCDVVAVASRDTAAAAETGRELGIPRAHGAYEDLLADDDVDAVYLPLPNHLHAPWAIAAARAGKHVLCEKPLALDAADAQRMVAEADAAGVAFMEGFMYRFHPVWERVREAIAAGRIGRLQTVHSHFSYHNDDPADIRNLAAAGGGALMDVGCYCIDVSRWLLGGEPRRVEAASRIEPDAGVDTLTTGILEFEQGTATFVCSTRMQPDQQLSVHGTHGRLTVEVPFNPRPDQPSRLHVVTGGRHPTVGAVETIEVPPVDQYRRQCEAFAAAVLAGREVPLSPREGVADMAVIERVRAAAAEPDAPRTR